MDPVPGVLFAQKEPRSNRRRGFRLLSPGDDSGQAPGEGGNPGPGELPEIHGSVAMGGFDRQGERVSIALWCSQLIVMWTLYGPEHEKPRPEPVSRPVTGAYGAPSGTRTPNPLIKSQLLYQLS